ncbi:hypothetical protein [Burkholderia sp. NLJ2]|uniref:hypothetical protein n=1 Tax=Burkholderia sp. NLJ2 TaxID=3090699 RepID=UPI003C6CB76D
MTSRFFEGVAFDDVPFRLLRRISSTATSMSSGRTRSGTAAWYGALPQRDQEILRLSRSVASNRAD